MPMCLVEKAWEILTQALPVEKCLQTYSHHHVGRASFLISGHKCSMSRWSFCLACYLEVQILELWVSIPRCFRRDKAHQDKCEEGQYSSRSPDLGGKERSLLIAATDTTQGPVEEVKKCHQLGHGKITICQFSCRQR